MNIEISEPKTIAETAGLSAVYMIAMVELYANGVGPGDRGIPYYWKDNAICARDDSGNIVGFISYRYEKGEGTLNLMTGFVAPKVRREGIYTKLWNKLVDIARKEGAVRIWGSTHVNNAPMREFYKKFGRVETHVNGMYEIPKESQ